STDTIGAFYKKGANLIAFDDNGGTDRNFRIERNVTAGTTYEVEVLHKNYTETGSYELVSEFTPTPRNPRDEAIPIDLNSITSGSIEQAGDADVFEINIPSAGTLVVYTTGSTDTIGAFYEKGARNSIAFDDNGGTGNNFRISQSVTAGKTYEVEVLHSNYTETGSYELVSEFTPSAQAQSALDIETLSTETPSTDYVKVRYRSATETGNYDLATRLAPLAQAQSALDIETPSTTPPDTPTPSTPRDRAIPIDLNDTISGSIDRVGDEDWFKVVIPSAGRLVAETTGTTDTKGYLYDASNSTPIGSSDTGGLGRNFKISEWLEAGTYYVAVRHSDSSIPSGDYLLVTYFNDNNDTSDGATPSSTSPEVTPDDHSNTRDGATSIEPNSTTSGNIETAGDEDYFKIVIPSRGTLVVETTGSTDTYGEFYNASGTSLQSNSNSGNFKITRDVTAGTYYVKVKHRNSETGSYSLVSEFTPDDHGNNGAKATLIEPTSTTQGNLETTRDEDWFKVVIPSGGGTLTVYTTGSTDTYGSLSDGNSHYFTSDDNGGTGNNFRISQSVTAGTYYVAVVRSLDSSSETGPYTLISEFTPASSQ
ncbi:MAG: pre-peptidase C-terminal domain-containing protein, partial [Sulfurovum sp.]|nr:pre-peptidase C-terminal domain-containing protein [Sulfurovum sp.]